MENESSIKELIRNSLEQVRTIVDADTVVGKQIVTPSGTVIIPVSKLSMGFASGGLDLPTKVATNDGKKNFGGGGGTGVSVSPVGFLTVTPDGKVDFIPMTNESLSPIEQVAELVYNSPDIIGRIRNIFLNGYPEPEKKDEKRSVELEDAYRDQLAQEAAEVAESLELNVDDEDVEPAEIDTEAMDKTERILFGGVVDLTREDKKRLKKAEKERKKREKLKKKGKNQDQTSDDPELEQAIWAIERAQRAEADANAIESDEEWDEVEAAVDTATPAESGKQPAGNKPAESGKQPAGNEPAENKPAENDPPQNGTYIEKTPDMDEDMEAFLKNGPYVIDNSEKDSKKKRKKGDDSDEQNETGDGSKEQNEKKDGSDEQEKKPVADPEMEEFLKHGQIVIDEPTDEKKEKNKPSKGERTDKKPREDDPELAEFAKHGQIVIEEPTDEKRNKKEKRANKRAEEVAPLPHNKRGKLSEKTLEKGRLK